MRDLKAIYMTLLDGITSELLRVEKANGKGIGFFLPYFFLSAI